MTKLTVSPPTHSVDVTVIHRMIILIKRWCLSRIAWLILSPLLFLVALEIILILAGFGRPHSLFIPAEQSGMVTTNPWFMSFYRKGNTTGAHPQRFARIKPDDTLRLFVLGESAAMGTPQPSFGFGRMLEVMLEPYYPGHHVEVINVAIRGIDSHLVTSIAEECAQYQPDVFIVYTGNNEMVGAHGPGAFAGRHPMVSNWLQSIKRLCISQAMQRLLVRRAHDQPQTMEFFDRYRLAGDDPRKERIYRNYQSNLKHICEIAFAANAAVLLGTVGTNLRDFSPLASMHHSPLSEKQLGQWERHMQQAAQAMGRGHYQEALVHYDQANKLDDAYAEHHYQWGQCLLALNDDESARQHLQQACDDDALPFRADHRLNEIVRAMHRELQGRPIWLVDVAHDLESNALPGDDLFRDHAHFNFKGDYVTANLLMSAVIEILREKNGLDVAEGVDPMPQDQCALRLGYTPWDGLNALESISTMMALPPFVGQQDHTLKQARLMQRIDHLKEEIDEAYVQEVLCDYQEALKLAPNDWNLHFNYANLLYTLKRYRAAGPHIEWVVQRFPRVAAFRVLHGYVLAGVGQKDRAVKEILKAKSLDAQSIVVYKAIQWMKQNGLK